MDFSSQLDIVLMETARSVGLGYTYWEDLMFNFLRLSALFALLASLLGGTYTPARAADNILFAKPSATDSGNCSSWTNACTLQIAIAATSSGDQIWVQAGTYRPQTSDRTVSFALKNRVADLWWIRRHRNPAQPAQICRKCHHPEWGKHGG